MLGNRELLGTLFCIALLVAGCSKPSGPTDESAADAPSPGPAPTEIQAALPVPPPETPAASPTESPAAPAALVEPAPASPAPVPSLPAAATAPPPQPVATAQPPRVSSAQPKPDTAPASVPVAAPAPAAAPTPAVVDVGGAIAVPATKSGLSRVGSEKCDMCHEVQFASWAKTAHATRKPPLDCEGCHGPGSAYKTMAIMQDPAKARAAGLVIPDRSFCSQCHVKGVSDDLLKRAHAHDDQTG